MEEGGRQRGECGEVEEGGRQRGEGGEVEEGGRQRGEGGEVEEAERTAVGRSAVWSTSNITLPHACPHSTWLSGRLGLSGFYFLTTPHLPIFHDK